jgi:propane monooxygenase reductase subunit
MVERGIQRKAVFYYGARTAKDLCFVAELEALEEKLPNFRFVPALSEPAADEAWDGEVGFITEVLQRYEVDLKHAHAYLCGPPPMVEAAMPLLASLGATEKHIYYDKFTTTGGED